MHSVPALLSFSPSYDGLGFKNVFYLPISPSSTRSTFPSSVLRPSFFAKSHLRYLNSAKAVSVSNDNENGLLSTLMALEVMT